MTMPILQLCSWWGGAIRAKLVNRYVGAEQEPLAAKYWKQRFRREYPECGAAGICGGNQQLLAVLSTAVIGGVFAPRRLIDLESL